MTFAPKDTCVWIELPVSDLDSGISFYSAVTGLTLKKQQMGPDVTAVFQSADPGKGVAGHLYTGKPGGDGTGPTVHLAAMGKLEDTVTRVTEAGGTVVSPILDIPAGRFFYATDPDGNSIGLFEVS
ncbi:VOC family protein [Nioella nitratireducens]|uniref:VOC family protein n=1 Tax=Nioella nitratireducens TaxID=1287720 RepID=UPI0008FD0C60|nr:VOC family protein [Nioella nitratireducens]